MAGERQPEGPGAHYATTVPLPVCSFCGEDRKVKGGLVRGSGAGLWWCRREEDCRIRAWSNYGKGA